MQRNSTAVPVLLLLTIAGLLGAWLGNLMHSQNNPLRGTLTFDPHQVQLRSGQSYQDGRDMTSPAPLGQPGVFYIAGSRRGEELTADLHALGLLP